MTADTAGSAVGIFGGTFDPPHVGHLILAEAALDTLSLAQVLFVPAANPPHKHQLPITDVKHRVAMVQAAISDNPHFAISDVDITRPGPHYTVDTLRLLRERMADTELFFLLGGDSFRDLPIWHDPSGVIAQAKIAVMLRPGAALDMAAMETSLPGITGRAAVVEAPMIGISATSLRERLQSGRSVRYQVPAAVERYIALHHLYTGQTESTVSQPATPH